jgi:hypothetical protein
METEKQNAKKSMGNLSNKEEIKKFLESIEN